MRKIGPLVFVDVNEQVVTFDIKQIPVRVLQPGPAIVWEERVSCFHRYELPLSDNGTRVFSRDGVEFFADWDLSYGYMPDRVLQEGRDHSTSAFLINQLGDIASYTCKRVVENLRNTVRAHTAEFLHLGGGASLVSHQVKNRLKNNLFSMGFEIHRFTAEIVPSDSYLQALVEANQKRMRAQADADIATYFGRLSSEEMLRYVLTQQTEIGLKHGWPQTVMAGSLPFVTSVQPGAPTLRQRKHDHTDSAIE